MPFAQACHCWRSWRLSSKLPTLCASLLRGSVMINACLRQLVFHSLRLELLKCAVNRRTNCDTSAWRYDSSQDERRLAMNSRSLRTTFATMTVILFTVCMFQVLSAQSSSATASQPGARNRSYWRKMRVSGGFGESPRLGTSY